MRSGGGSRLVGVRQLLDVVHPVSADAVQLDGIVGRWRRPRRAKGSPRVLAGGWFAVAWRHLLTGGCRVTPVWCGWAASSGVAGTRIDAAPFRIAARLLRCRFGGSFQRPQAFVKRVVAPGGDRAADDVGRRFGGLPDPGPVAGLVVLVKRRRGAAWRRLPPWYAGGLSAGIPRWSSMRFSRSSSCRMSQTLCITWNSK